VAEDDSLFSALDQDQDHDDDLDMRGGGRPDDHVRADTYDDYYQKYAMDQRGGRKKQNKYRPPYFLSGPVAPVPGGLGAMGYPYQVGRRRPSPPLITSPPLPSSVTFSPLSSGSCGAPIPPPPPPTHPPLSRATSRRSSR
jgi:hypothetical protein